MEKISRERADEILEQLDEIALILHSAGMLNHANTLVGLVDELEEDFATAAADTNPFFK